MEIGTVYGPLPTRISPGGLRVIRAGDADDAGGTPAPRPGATGVAGVGAVGVGGAAAGRSSVGAGAAAAGIGGANVGAAVAGAGFTTVPPARLNSTCRSSPIRSTVNGSLRARSITTRVINGSRLLLATRMRSMSSLLTLVIAGAVPAETPRKSNTTRAGRSFASSTPDATSEPLPVSVIE